MKVKKQKKRKTPVTVLVIDRKYLVETLVGPEIHELKDFQALNDETN